MLYLLDVFVIDPNCTVLLWQRLTQVSQRFVRDFTRHDVQPCKAWLPLATEDTSRSGFGAVATLELQTQQFTTFEMCFNSPLSNPVAFVLPT